MIHPCIFRVDEAPSAEAIPRVADAGIEKVFTLTRSGTYSRNGGLESASRTEAEDEEGAVAIERATRLSPDREGGRSSHARRGGADGRNSGTFDGSCRREWKHILKRADIGRWRLKELRDTYACQLLSCNVPLGYASTQLGPSGSKPDAQSISSHESPLAFQAETTGNSVSS